MFVFVCVSLSMVSKHHEDVFCLRKRHKKQSIGRLLYIQYWSNLSITIDSKSSYFLFLPHMNILDCLVINPVWSFPQTELSLNAENQAQTVSTWENEKLYSTTDLVVRVASHKHLCCACQKKIYNRTVIKHRCLLFSFFSSTTFTIDSGLFVCASKIVLSCERYIFFHFAFQSSKNVFIYKNPKASKLQ